jgi:hypothetical protein
LAPSSVARYRYRAKVGLDGAALAFHRGILDLQVGQGKR